MNPNKFAIPHKAEIPPGAWGVWQIPSLNVSVPLYRGNNPVTAQADVDRENSANYRRFGCGHIISDHAGSRSNGGKGVWDLWQLHPDDAAFLILPDGTQTFVCQMVCRVDVHPSSYTMDGQSVYPRRATDVLCVGCATKDGKQNYLAIFKQTGVIP